MLNLYNANNANKVRVSVKKFSVFPLDLDNQKGLIVSE